MKIYATSDVHGNLDGLNPTDERCGTVRNDVTNRTDVAYETVDGATWRVTTQSVTGPRTNAVVVTRVRLTGLSDACRSHLIVRAADGAVTETRMASRRGARPTRAWWRFRFFQQACHSF